MTAIERRAKDREWMLHPDLWPHLVLPLRRTGAPSCAYLVSGPDVTGAFVLHIGNIWVTGDKTAPTRTYTSVDAVLDEGWTVD